MGINNLRELLFMRTLPMLGLGIKAKYRLNKYVDSNKGIKVMLASYAAYYGLNDRFDIAYIGGGNLDYYPLIELLHRIGKK